MPAWAGSKATTTVGRIHLTSRDVPDQIEAKGRDRLKAELLGLKSMTFSEAAH